MYLTDRGASPQVIGGQLRNLGQAAALVPNMGTFPRIEHEVNQILADAAAVRRWRAQPGLLPGDLQIRAQVQQFTAHNFAGDDKCNLFALDIAWRSGFCAPIVVRSANPLRYGYPSTNNLAWLAQRALHNGNWDLTGRDGTQWGYVDTEHDREQINRWIAQGFSEFVVGWRHSGTGHIGVISNVVNINRDAQGRITDLTYEGWEASTRAGARRVMAGTGSERWRTDQGNLGQCNQPYPQGTNLFRVFRVIHIIGLVAELDQARRAVVVDAGGWCNLN